MGDQVQIGSGKWGNLNRRSGRASRRATTAMLLTGAAAAALGHAHRASAANTVYTFTGPGGTAIAPTTGDFNTSTNFLGGIPLSGTNTSSATELDFNGSGGTSYTATNDIGSATFYLTEIQLGSTSTATDVLAANASTNTFTFVNSSSGSAPTILQNGTGAFNIGNGINQLSSLTIGGTGTGALTFTGAVGPTAASTTTANINVAYTGAPVTFTGTLNTNHYQALNIGTGATVVTTGTLDLRVNESGSTEGNNVTGAGTLQLAGTTNSLSSPDLYFGPDHSGTAYYGAEMTVANLNLGSAQRYIVSNSGHNSVGEYLRSSPEVDAFISSNISGGGGITFQGNPNSSNPTFFAELVLAGSNSFTGPVQVNQGAIYLDSANALTQSNALTLQNNGTGYSHFFLLGNSTTVSNLTSSGSAQGNTGIANGNPKMYLQFGAATLTVNQTANTTFAGPILNTLTDNYDDTSGSVPGNLSLTKTGPATLTLAGSSNYSGGTTVTAGTLALGPGGSLGNTAITVAGGAGFAARIGAGTSSTPGTLSLASGATFDMLDGAAGTFNLSNAGTGLTLAGGNTLGFDLAGSATDLLAVTGAAAVTGNNTINITASGSIQNGTYNLITAASGLNGGTFVFGNGATTETVTEVGSTVPYILSLLNSGTAEQLTVTSGATTDYWAGSINGTWNAGSGTTATNWTSDRAGTVPASVPNSSTNVIFTVAGGGQNLNTLLGQDLTIASLTFTSDANQSVTIGGPNNLTVSAGGISINAGSGSHTISTASLVLGANQTWTNLSGNPFTVSAPITGSASNLALAGTGTFVLTGANTYAATNISAGASVQVGNGGTSGTLGTGVVVDNGTLTFNRSDVATVVSGAINGSGNIVQAGTGTAIVAGAVTTTGTTTVNSGTLQLASLTAPAVSGAVTVNSNANLTVTAPLTVPSAAGAFSVAGGANLSTGAITVPAVNGALSLNGSLISTGTLTLNASTSAAVTPIGGGGTIYLAGTSTSATAPDINANIPSNAYYGLTITNNIVVGPGTHYIGGHSGNNSFGEYSTGDLALQGSLSGTGGLVVSGAPQDSQFEVVLENDDSNWTGPLTINQGEVAISTGNTAAGVNPLTAANSVAFTPAAGNTAALYLFGNNLNIGNLSGTGAGSMYIRNGGLTNVSNDGTSSDAVLIVNQTTNATFAGVISDGPNDYKSGVVANASTGSYNRLGLTLAAATPSTTLTLSGSNSYTGPTTIQSGRLALTPGAALGNTAISVAAGTTLAPSANTSAGVTTVAGAGATLSVNGGTLDMTAGGTATTTGTFALHQSGSVNQTQLTLSNATLGFTVSPSGADNLAVDGTASVSGTNLVNLLPLPGTYTPVTYPLISAVSGLTGTFDFSNGTTTETINGVTYALLNTDGLESLAIDGGSAVPLVAYYTGSLTAGQAGVLTAGGNGTPTNFATDGTGSTKLTTLPGPTTNVFFTANGAQNLTTTLGANLSINSLTFTANAPGQVTLGGANTLTIGAGGITANYGAPAATISTASYVIGADQTWTNNSGNPLTVSAPVSGGNLTIAGTGTTVLTGTNTYGYTNISSGATLQIGNGTAAGTLGAGTVTDNGTLAFNRPDSVTLAGLSGSGAIVQAGTGTLSLSGAITTTGGLSANAGTLAVTGSLSGPGGLTANGGSITVSGSVASAGGITVNGGAISVGGNVTNPGAVAVNSGSFNVSGSLTTTSSNAVTVAGGAYLRTYGTLNVGVSGSTSTAGNDVTGGGTVQLLSTTGSTANPDVYFGPDSSGTTYAGAEITAATLDLGSTQRFINANSDHNAVGVYLGTTNGVDAEITSSIIGSGGITFNGSANSSHTNFFAQLVLAGSNTFTGTLEVDQGSVYLYNANALNLPAGNPVVLNNSGTGYSHLFLYGNNATVANLTSAGTAPANIAVANGNPTNVVTVGPATLTDVQTTATTFAGTIADTVTDNYNSGSNVPGALSLVKSGPGTLALSGKNTYTGGTSITAGTLAANNANSSLGAGTTTITGGVLAGTGATGGPVVVSSGGTITAGTGATLSDTVGNLSTGAQTWSAGGTYVAKLDAANVNSDRLIMTGLTAAPAAGFNVNIVGTSASSAGGTYVLAVDTTATYSATSDPFNSAALTLTVNGAPAPATDTLSDVADTTGLGGVDLILSTAAAPEPTSLLLAGLAAAPLLLGRRRRAGGARA